eukprot:COSAG02_NODE_37367_length_442_cov_14.720117_1_plen_142_part_01
MVASASSGQRGPLGREESEGIGREAQEQQRYKDGAAADAAPPTRGHAAAPIQPAVMEVATAAAQMAAQMQTKSSSCRFDSRKICARQRHRSGSSAVNRVLSRESAHYHQPRLSSASADIKQAMRSPEGLSQAREESSYGRWW